MVFHYLPLSHSSFTIIYHHDCSPVSPKLSLLNRFRSNTLRHGRCAPWSWNAAWRGQASRGCSHSLLARKSTNRWWIAKFVAIPNKYLPTGASCILDTVAVWFYGTYSMAYLQYWELHIDVMCARGQVEPWTLAKHIQILVHNEYSSNRNDLSASSQYTYTLGCF